MAICIYKDYTPNHNALIGIQLHVLGVLPTGGLQLVFTIVTGAWAIATFYSYPLALLWQAIKWVVPLYHGACHSARTTNLPKARLRPAVVTVIASSNCPPPKADFESSYKKRE